MDKWYFIMVICIVVAGAAAASYDSYTKKQCVVEGLKTERSVGDIAKVCQVSL